METKSSLELMHSPLWRTFSIFISSTFADMQAERDYLKAFVFPKVEEELNKNRIKLQIVDLRWGVDTTSIEKEDDRELNVLKVCLEEIRRSRPFFIGLLGDRYGWIPPEERMKAALSGESQFGIRPGKSVTDLEIEYGVLGSQEQLIRSVFYFRNPLPYERFPKERVPLFCDALNPSFSEDQKSSRVKALNDLKAKISSYFDDRGLKDKIKSYDASWDVTSSRVTGLEQWGETVYRDILTECETHAKETWQEIPKTWHEKELELLNAFVEQHTHIIIFKTKKGTEEIPTFCGRENLLKRLTDFLLSADNKKWGYILTGESGSGKSAVFSKAYRILEGKNCFVLAHSAGLSPRSGRVNDLLEIWNNRLRMLLGREQVYEETENETKKENRSDSFIIFRNESPEKNQVTVSVTDRLQGQFSDLLSLAAARHRIVLMVDALDRFEVTERAQFMSWLPSPVPMNVKALFTCIAGTEDKVRQYHRDLETINLDEFSVHDANEMLHALCRRQHKTLSENAKRIILEKKRPEGKPAIISPLWLSLSVTSLMAMDIDDFEKISRLEGRGDQQIEAYILRLATDFDPMPGPLFVNLIRKAEEVFGAKLTRSVFECIATSRFGLNERDIEALAPEKTWDPMLFANLRRWFRLHLVMQGEDNQWNLTHSILRQAIIEQTNEATLKNLHTSLAHYHWSFWNDPKRAAETLYHFISTGQLTEAALYYGGMLNEDNIEFSTDILASIMTTTENGVENVSSLPEKVVVDRMAFNGVFKRYLYNLNRALSRGGYLQERMILMKRLYNAYLHHTLTYSVDQHLGYDLAGLLHDLGVICEEAGKTDEALDFYERSTKIIQQLIDSNPSERIYKLGLAISYETLGGIRQRLGIMESAISLYNKAFSLVKEIYDANPANEGHINHLAIAHGYLGSYFNAIGKTEEAIKNYETALSLSKALASRYPLDYYYNQGLIKSYSHLGSLHLALGQIDDAVNYYNNGFLVCKRMFSANPGAESAKENLAHANLDLGNAYYLINNEEGASKCYNEALELFLDLSKANKGKETFRSKLAETYNAIGDMRMNSGRTSEAMGFFLAGYELNKELHDNNRGSESLTNDLAVSCGYLSRLLLSLRRPEEAMNYSLMELKILTDLQESGISTMQTKANMAGACLRLGIAYQSTGNQENALKYFSLSTSLYNELTSVNKGNQWLLNEYSTSLNSLGELYQAKGDLGKAYKYFYERHLISKDLSISNPGNDTFRSKFGFSFAKLGDIHLLKDQVDEAHKCFNEEALIFQKLCEEYPHNNDYKNYLAIALGRLGDIYLLKEEMEEALKYVLRRLDLSKELFETNPEKISNLEGYCIGFYKAAIVCNAMGDNLQGIRYFNRFSELTANLISRQPQVAKYRDWQKLEYDLPASSPVPVNVVRPVVTQPAGTKMTEDSNEEKLLSVLINSGEFQKAMQILSDQEAEIRTKSNNSREFQKNIGKQAIVLHKMGKHKDALHKFETQAEVCSRNGLEEDYADSLINQATILIENLNKPGRAKTLLAEAVSIATENEYSHLLEQAKKLLKKI